MKYVKIPYNMVFDKSLSSTDLHIYIVIKSYMEYAPSCALPYRGLAFAANVTPSTVVKSIKRLTEKGLITKEKGRPNSYRAK